MICSVCDKQKPFVLKYPFTIESENEDGIVRTFTDRGFDKNGHRNNICLDCLKSEAESIFELDT